MNTSQGFLAIEAGRFLPFAEFQSRMERLIASVKSARPAQGYEEILVAGDPEWRAEAERARDGIPVEESLWQRITDLARELGIDDLRFTIDD